MKKIITSLLFSIAMAMGLAGSAFAQTALVRSTLTNAITTNQATFVVGSTTGFVASTVSAQSYVLVDNELMLLRAIPVSGTITVTRAQAATNGQAHIAGATIIWGLPGTWATQTGNASGVFISSTPVGGCVRTSNQYLPIINVGQKLWYNCLGGAWQAQTMLDSGIGGPATRVCNIKQSGIALVSMGVNTIPGTAGNFYYSTFFNPTTRVVNSISPLWGVTVGSATGWGAGIYEWNTVTSGALLFNTTTAGTASGTASTFQGIAVGTVGILTGPATYMFFLNNAGTTDGAMLLNGNAESFSTLRAGTFGTLPATVAAATGYVSATAAVACYN